MSSHSPIGSSISLQSLELVPEFRFVGLNTAFTYMHTYVGASSAIERISRARWMGELLAFPTIKSVESAVFCG